MKVNVQYAQTHFPDLASAAYRGEEVEIANPDVAKTLRLVVSDSPARSETSTIEDTGNSVFEEWRVLNREVERQIAEEATRSPHLFKHHGGPGRLLSESLAILQRRNSSVTIDPDFADDVQAAIDAHRNRPTRLHGIDRRFERDHCAGTCWVCSRTINSQNH